MNCLAVSPNAVLSRRSTVMPGSSQLPMPTTIPAPSVTFALLPALNAIEDLLLFALSAWRLAHGVPTQTLCSLRYALCSFPSLHDDDVVLEAMGRRLRLLDTAIEPPGALVHPELGQVIRRN